MSKSLSSSQKGEKRGEKKSPGSTNSNASSSAGSPSASFGANNSSVASNASSNVDGSEVIESSKIEALEKQLQCVESVIRYITANSLSPSDSVFYILANSVNVQRVAVLTQLRTHLEADPRMKVATLKVLCQELLQHDAEVQVAGAKGFATVLTGGDLTAAQRGAIFPEIHTTTFRVLAGPARAAWLDAYCILLKGMCPEDVERFVLHEVFDLCVSSDVTVRVVAPLVITHALAILPSFGTSARLLHAINKLALDTVVDVRLELARSFLDISRPLPALIVKEHLLVPMVRLLLDDEMRVSCASFVCLVEWCQILDEQFVQAFIFPVLRQYVVACPQPVQETVARQFGKLVWYTRRVGADQSGSATEHAELFMSIYLALAGSPDEVFRVHCAFNFPGVAASIAPTSFAAVLSPTLRALAADASTRVRVTIAGGFHELCGLLGATGSELLAPPFIRLFSDPDANVRSKLVANLTVIFNAFSTGLCKDRRNEFFALCAPLLEQYEKDISTNWRKVAMLLTHAKQFPTWFSVPQLHQHFVPQLVKHLAAGASALKPAVCSTVSIFFRTLASDDDKVLSIKSLRRIVADLGGCKSAAGRIAFIDLCEDMLHRFSMRYFKTFLLPAVASLKSDPVTNVRLRVARFLPVLSKAASHTVEDVPIGHLLDTMLADKDPDVAAAAATAGGGALTKLSSSLNPSDTTSHVVYLESAAQRDEALLREEGDVVSSKVQSIVAKLEAEEKALMDAARPKRKLSNKHLTSSHMGGSGGASLQGRSPTPSSLRTPSGGARKK